MEKSNETGEFILKGFPGSHVLHTAMFMILLLVLFVTLAGNVFIITIICSNYCLHTPMYFFLVCLSFMEIIASCTVLPNLLFILITRRSSISRAGCFIQSYIYYFVSMTDFLILTVMSFDRYLAVCSPLRYTSIMRNQVCIKLVSFCIITTFLFLLYPTIITPRLPYCHHVIDHFICESAAILKLVCVDITFLILNTIIVSVFLLIGCLIVTTISYILIVLTVVRMPSDVGRQKTFSTCLSHLIMLSIVFGSAIFIEIRPPHKYSVETDKMVNLVSTVLGPLLNPFIYTLRNEKVKECIKDTVRRRTVF
uniref:Olfactory receptor n=1 Tax=Pyxicephalus adspersus TaxID=30357 RepID=A0AAV3A7E1_PYXAD|nr:TPA: hypothetical protein GDO54_013605 [Pyxicephalus adspersus]